MGKLSALALAGAMSVGATYLAKAADLLPPPPEPVYAAPVEFGGWYLRGDVGVGVNQLDMRSSTFAPGVVVDNPHFDEADLRTTAIVGGGVGYQFNSWFRADVTGEYHFDSAYHAIQSYGPTFCGTNTGRCYDGYNAKISNAVFLANGYVDLGTWYNVTPYVGGGVGVARTMISGLTDVDLGGSGAGGYAADRSQTNFAWALMAGVSYSLTSNIKLDFNYRYLNMGTASSNAIICNGSCTYEVQRYRLSSHDVRLGLRYMFADATPPTPALVPFAPPPGPIVRKY